MQKRIRWCVWSLFAVLMIYVGISVYFMDHFFPRTSINHRNAEFLTTRQVKDMVMQQARDYKLVLKGRQGETEELAPQSMGVSYYETDAVDQIKRIQNGFLWPRIFWQADSYQLTA